MKRPALQRYRLATMAAEHGAGKRVRLWILRLVERIYSEARNPGGIVPGQDVVNTAARLPGETLMKREDYERLKNYVEEHTNLGPESNK